MSHRRLALLVATYSYQDAGLRQLAAPGHDAESLADVLRRPDIAGFDVTILVNKPHQDVGEAIGKLYRDRRRDDLTLLYFTGHGLKDDDGRLYFAMTNTRRDNLLFTALSAEQIDRAMDSCSSRRKILVLDCCYSGAFPAGRISKADTQVDTLEKFQGRGRVVLTASDAMQYSFEGNHIVGQGTQSVFTRFFVDGLTTGEADLDGDGDISLDELYSYVYDRVTEEMPQQRPGKKEDVEGRIVIAENIYWRLPAHVQNAIKSPFTPDRLEVLKSLARLHRIGNNRVRSEVIRQVRHLIHDSNDEVSTAAIGLMMALNPDLVREAEERARREAEERARREAEERARREAEERARREAEERARREAEERARREAEERARREAEERARREAEERARREAEERGRREAEERGRREAEERGDERVSSYAWKQIFQSIILWRPRSRSVRRAMPGALLILLVVVGIIVIITVPSGTTNNPLRTPTGPVQPGLERFYSQNLSWGGCSSFAATPDDKEAYTDPGLECAHLTVPLDYANPNGRQIKLGLLRRPASDQAHRIGSLLINPGGPGASGMSAAASLAGIVAKNDLGRRFDLVGFDPRGVGASEPQVVCRTPAERDAERLMNLGVDSSPVGVERTENQEKADVAGCVSRTGKDMLANIGTRDVVRDMDIMRSVLGDERLNYLGYSYGTRLGAAYAEVFPKNVRAMILDGADPPQDPIAQLIEQGEGFQKAFDKFVAWCVGQPSCGLGGNKDQAVSSFQNLVRPLINQPVAVSDGRKLSYTDATIGTVLALYSPRFWSTLNSGLQELAHGRGDTLMLLADAYYQRGPDGTYSTEMDVFQSVLCTDNPPIKDPNVARDVDSRYRKVAPFLDSGQPPSPALDNCAFWPVPPTSGPHQLQTPGLPTVVVISTTEDPAAPYQAGVRLANDLKARLLTYEGTQHTAFLQRKSIVCIDRAGIDYLIKLDLPAEGTRCKDAT